MKPVPALPCPALRESRRTRDATTDVAASTTHSPSIEGCQRLRLEVVVVVDVERIVEAAW